MGRLEHHRQKQYRNKIVFTILIIFLAIYLMFTFGFKILLTTSSYIASLTNKKDVQKTTSNSEYGQVTIDNIPDATNSANIIVSGTAVNFDEILFYINGEKVKDIDLSSSYGFSEEIGDLKVGSNEVFVKAKQKNDKLTKNSQIFNVIFKNNKPKLEIKEPADNSTIHKSDLLLKGSTDKEIFVKINDLPIVVDANGDFQTTLFLKEGDNNLTIIAQDMAGNSETKTLKITYSKD